MESNDSRGRRVSKGGGGATWLFLGFRVYDLKWGEGKYSGGLRPQSKL